MTSFEANEAFAKKCDGEDSLSNFREEFCFPEHEKQTVYLCGNSLGLQPIKVREYVNNELDDWAKYGVHGHHAEYKEHSWVPYHEFVAPSLAKLVGASPTEVVAMNTLTVNVQLMLASFYRPEGKRTKVIRAYHGFPSDRFALETHLAVRGIEPEGNIIDVPPGENEYFSLEACRETIAKHRGELALLFMDGVNYYTGQVLPMKEIAMAAREAGVPIGFDLAHGVGNVPLSLHDWGIDFATWCSYKYLNGGPGCIAGTFVHERYAKEFERPRLAGWWGHDKETRFQMGPKFKPIVGAEGWQLSNPPILPLAALRASLEQFDRAGIDALRSKSIKLTGYLEYLLKALHHDITIFTPENPGERGCQLSLSIGGQGKGVFEAVSQAGVFCDWREPNVIRIAPVPMYNSFQDVFRFVELLDEAMS